MATPAKYKIGLIQMAFGTDSEANLQRAIGKIEEAARNGAQLVCLPELFLSETSTPVIPPSFLYSTERRRPSSSRGIEACHS